MAAQVRTGGKGSVRRKKKAIHKTTTTDDKRLQNTLKRLGVNNIPAIEEVNLFKDNGTVIHFNNPKGVDRRQHLCCQRPCRIEEAARPLAGHHQPAWPGQPRQPEETCRDLPRRRRPAASGSRWR